MSFDIALAFEVVSGEAVEPSERLSAQREGIAVGVIVVVVVVVVMTAVVRID